MRCFPAQRSIVGFTLVELMVSIALVAIVASVAVPSFNSLVQGNRLISASNQLLSAFHTARSEAIKRSQTITLCATSDGSSCAATSDWSNWLIMAGNEIVVQGRLADGLNVSGPAATSINFTALGLVRDNSGAGFASTVQVCTTSSAVSDNTRILSFVAGGSISVMKGATSCG